MIGLRARGLPLAFCSLCRIFAQRSIIEKRSDLRSKISASSAGSRLLCNSPFFQVDIRRLKHSFSRTVPAVSTHAFSDSSLKASNEGRLTGSRTDLNRSEPLIKHSASRVVHLAGSEPLKSNRLQSSTLRLGRFHSGSLSCSTMTPAVAESTNDADQVSGEAIIDGFGSGVIVREPEELERKMRAMKEAGVDKLQVIADFDMTLTKFMVNGHRGQSCHVLVRTENEEVNERRRLVHNKYYPMEIDPTIPFEKKLPLMEEWWATSHGLIVEGGLSLHAIQHSVAHANIDLRQQTAHLFQLLDACNVPVLIFSAGLADIIEEVLLQKLDRPYPNVRVVGNRMEFDKSGRLVGFKGKVIHVLNKNEHALEIAGSGDDPSANSGEKDDGAAQWRENLHKRKNVLLLGDHLGDLRMSDGVMYENRITVGFLNDNVEQQLEKYTAAFDIVVLNDGSMDVAVDLIKSLM